MKTELITYAMGALTAEGALVYDDTVTGKRPALLMAPNWLGMTEQRSRAPSSSPATAMWSSSPTCMGRGLRPDFAGAPALANPLRENAARATRAASAPPLIR